MVFGGGRLFKDLLIVFVMGLFSACNPIEAASLDRYIKSLSKTFLESLVHFIKRPGAHCFKISQVKVYTYKKSDPKGENNNKRAGGEKCIWWSQKRESEKNSSCNAIKKTNGELNLASEDCG